jgi:hypothetical protein
MSEERKVSTFWQEIASGDRELPRLVSDFWLAAAAGAELPKPPPVERGGWREPFLRAVRGGRSQKDAAAAAGVSIRTVHRYGRSHPAFRAAVASATGRAEPVDPAARELAAVLARAGARRE